MICIQLNKLKFYETEIFDLDLSDIDRTSFGNNIRVQEGAEQV